MKNIVIIRHATAEKGDHKHPDMARELTEQGIKDAKLMGQVLKKLKINPGIILSSTARRAEQTALAISENVEFKGNINFVEEFYTGNEQDIFRHMVHLPDNMKNIVIGGHNPTLEHLLILLLNSNHKKHYPLIPATMSSIHIPIEHWLDLDFHLGELKWMLTPNYVREKYLKK